MENRFAQTVDSTYNSRLPCGAPRSVSCLCFNVIIISDATENVNSWHGFFRGTSPQNFEKIVAIFAQYVKKVSISRFINEIEEPLNSELKQVSVGDKVYHSTFKEGKIIEKKNNMITVKFKNSTKTLDYKICLKNKIIRIL